MNDKEAIKYFGLLRDGQVLKEQPSFNEYDGSYSWFKQTKREDGSLYEADHTEDGIRWREMYRNVDGTLYKVDPSGDWCVPDSLLPICRIDDI